jgi:hypothetical protein
MSRLPADQPDRLLSSDATDFERRMLEAALQKRPSSASSARMARAIGVSVAAVGAATTGTTLAAGAGAANATATAGSAIWPLVSVGVIGLVVASAVVGARSRHSDGDANRKVVSAPIALPAPPPPEPIAPAEPSAIVAAPPSRAVGSGTRARGPATAGDLGDQVAFIDSARAAVSTGASRRALEILRRYQDKYPTGSFRPEATAIKVEALMKLGREAEARGLAERFVAEHRGTLLARRVADLAGLTVP